MSTAKSIICFFLEHNLPKPTRHRNGARYLKASYFKTTKFFVFTWYAVATSTPNNIFFQVRQLEKNILGIRSKKILSALRLLYFFTNSTQAERCLAD